MERRRWDRRDVRLTCYVATDGSGAHRVTGVSENISRRGILLRLHEEALAPDSIAVGGSATVDVELPAEHALAPRCMHCEGRVVRIASHNAEVEIAVRVDTMQFRTLGAEVLPFLIEGATHYIM